MNHKKMLSLIFLVSANLWAAEEAPARKAVVRADVADRAERNERFKHEPKFNQNERDTQIVLGTVFAGSIAAYAFSHYFDKSPIAENIGSVCNLSARDFRAGCALAGILGGAGLIAKKRWGNTLRSNAWRAPLIAMVGGAVAHPRVNSALCLAPWGLGGWFKENQASDSKAIFAIYCVGAWALLKPSLDRLESFVAGLYNRLKYGKAVPFGDGYRCDLPRNALGGGRKKHSAQAPGENAAAAEQEEEIVEDSASGEAGDE